MESRALLLTFLTVLCLCGLISESHACNCLVNHPQTKFCGADFVLRVRILERSKFVHPDTTRSSVYRYLIEYRTEVLDAYKGRDYVGDAREILVHSPDAGGLCGVSGLWSGDVYVISGRYVRDMFYITYCDLWFEYEKLSDEQISGLMRDYAQNCNCRIRGVFGIVSIPERAREQALALDKSPLWNDGSCRYNPVASLYYQTQECETKYSHCAFINDTCMWARTPSYDLCYKARESIWHRRNIPPKVSALRRRVRCNPNTMPFLNRCMSAKERRQRKRLEAQGLAAEVPTPALLTMLGGQSSIAPSNFMPVAGS
ncbi:tissue inhibitor of metalloproteinase-like [Diadema antillarum]|uniref:tissue inhibitor of metalloproteinase-like n=1 Tax=Diadema antillarum TaxID=105358 RepID=UPI003A83E824